MTLYVLRLYPRMTAGVARARTHSHTKVLPVRRAVSQHRHRSMAAHTKYSELYTRSGKLMGTHTPNHRRGERQRASERTPRHRSHMPSLYLPLSPSHTQRCRRDRKTLNIPPIPSISTNTHTHTLLWEGTPPLFLTQTHSSLTRLYTVTGYPVAPKIAAPNRTG